MLCRQCANAAAAAQDSLAASRTTISTTEPISENVIQF